MDSILSGTGMFQPVGILGGGLMAAARYADLFPSQLQVTEYLPDVHAPDGIGVEGRSCGNRLL